MTLYEFKVVLLGQSCVGKTSLVLRYISNVFNQAHQSTLPASFLEKQLYLEQDLVRLSIWDTAGQEKFYSLGPIYYRKASGALLVYDVTDPDSLRRVRDWVKELNRTLGLQNVRLAIVGNKTDLLVGEARQSALVQEAEKLAEELLNASHHLTSAKQNQGIEQTFLGLVRRMVEQQKRCRSFEAGARFLVQGQQRAVALYGRSGRNGNEHGASRNSGQVSRTGKKKGGGGGPCQC